MAVRDFLRDHWPAAAISATAAAIGAAAVAMLLGMPPHRIVMATGPEGDAYYEIGKRYQAVLARANVDLQLVTSAGSVQNRALLRDPRSGVSVALIEGGVGTEADSSQLQSLGTMFYEPVWWFYRRGIAESGPDALRGRKVSIGPEGSGTRALSIELIQRAGTLGQFAQVLPFSPRTAAEKLTAGEIDIAFILSSWDSPAVQALLADDRVALSGFPHADALVAIYPFLSKLVLPKGVTDIPKERPPADVTLIAAKASLVIRGDLHPAIQYLLLNAAAKIHSGPGIFNAANRFPAAEAVDIPLSDEAARFYKSGMPFLNDYFPFWMAALIGKLIILLIPVIGVLYPMVRFLPRLFDWAMRSKVLGIYGELRLLEDEIARAGGKADRNALTARLDNLEKEANHLRMPLAYASMLYTVRDHIGLVREALNKERSV